jgi:hypothetical protein
MRVKGIESSLQSHAVINTYTKSIVFLYPEKKHVEVKTGIKKEPQTEQKVLYEDNDGRVIVKDGLNNGENSIKR